MQNIVWRGWKPNIRLTGDKSDGFGTVSNSPWVRSG
jgi:hypothetical protein